MALLEDREGNIWAAVREIGVNFFSTRKPLFQRFSQETGNPNSLDRTLVAAIHEDRQGIVWVGTSGALDLIDRKTGQYTAYRTAGTSLSIPMRPLYLEDDSGALWVGNDGQGLERFDRRTGQFRDRRDRRAGVSSSIGVILRIFRDRTGALWVLSRNDLERFRSVDEALDRLPTDRQARLGMRPCPQMPIL